MTFAKQKFEQKATYSQFNRPIHSAHFAPVYSSFPTRGTSTSQVGTGTTVAQLIKKRSCQFIR